MPEGDLAHPERFALATRIVVQIWKKAHQIQSSGTNITEHYIISDCRGGQPSMSMMRS